MPHHRLSETPVVGFVGDIRLFTTYKEVAETIENAIGPSLDEHFRRTVVPIAKPWHTTLAGASDSTQPVQQGDVHGLLLHKLPRDILPNILQFLSPYDILSLRAGAGKWPGGENPVATHARDRRARAAQSFDGWSNPDAIIGQGGRAVKAVLCSLFLTLRKMLPSLPSIAGPSQAMRDVQAKNTTALMAMPQIELYWCTSWYLMLVAAYTVPPYGVTALRMHPLPDPPTVLPAAAAMVHEMLLWCARQRYHCDRQSLDCIAKHLQEDGDGLELNVSSRLFDRVKPPPCGHRDNDPGCLKRSWTQLACWTGFVPHEMCASSMLAVADFATADIERGTCFDRI